MVHNKKGTYFYAVRYGRKPGIYNTWAECEAQVKSHPRSVYKKFPSKKEAQAFVGDVSDLQDDIEKLALDDKYPPIPHVSEEDTVVYTDGVYWGPGHSRNTSEILKGKRQTSQRAKIGAVNHALEQSQNDTGLLEIISSHYVIQSVNTWSKKWVFNNWKRVDGLEVENRDLFEITLSLIESRKGKVELIYGSDNKYSEGIEEAGKLALAGAQKQKDTSI